MCLRVALGRRRDHDSGVGVRAAEHERAAFRRRHPHCRPRRQWRQRRRGGLSGTIMPPADHHTCSGAGATSARAATRRAARHCLPHVALSVCPLDRRRSRDGCRRAGASCQCVSRGGAGTTTAISWPGRTTPSPAETGRGLTPRRCDELAPAPAPNPQPQPQPPALALALSPSPSPNHQPQP